MSLLDLLHSFQQSFRPSLCSSRPKLICTGRCHFQSFHGGNAVVLQYQLRELSRQIKFSQFGFVDFEMTFD
jgi:hypothetical protein